MKQIYIIKAGTTFSNIVKEHGDFEDWIAHYITDAKVKIVDVEKDEPLPEMGECLGVIVTGSHAMVTDELPWSLKTELFIRELVKSNIPLLGICYGHQLIAKSLGGHVDFNPKGMELGTVSISTNANAKNDEIFKNFPQTFDVHAVHAQSVLKLPTNAVLLASNDFDKNHIFKIEPCTWGVQFHPEYNESIMKSYIHEVLKDEIGESEKENKLIKNVKNTLYANKIIKIFVDIAKMNQSLESKI